MKKYILFSGEFVQQSALSISGSEVEANFIDSFFARDGNGRLTIPGSSIAGSIVSFAHKMGFDLEKEFTCKYKKMGNNEQITSLMRVFNCHTEGDVQCEVRQMNGLIQKTRATAEEKSALFNVECTPVGTRWPFLIEVEVTEEKGQNVAAILAKVLNFWREKFGFLGGLTSRGMGWVKIEELKAIETDGDHWPNSTLKNPVKAILKSDKDCIINTLIKNEKLSTPWKYKHIKGTVKAGVREDGYGIDSLMIGGSEYTRWDFEKSGVKDKMRHPDGLSKDKFLTEGDHSVKGADHFFVISNYKGGQHPVIPGSSIKGAFRHFLSAGLRAEGFDVEDPNLKEPDFSKDNSAIKPLFGFVDSSDADDSALMIRDAEIKDINKYTMAMFEHHAEDEFTQGAYGSSKFNEVALVEGEFEFEMVVVEREENLQKSYDELLKKLKIEGEKAMIDLGGKAFRGHGWPKIVLKIDETWKNFGEV